jgi:hypothetical protein
MFGIPIGITQGRHRAQWEDRTIQKRAARGYTKERERNNNQNDFFLPTEERAPFLTAKER